MCPARPEFGLAIDFARPADPGEDRTAQIRTLIDLAEESGFQSVWAGEQYAVNAERIHLPGPFLVLASLIPQSTLKLGTGVLVLSHYLDSRYAMRLLEDLPNGAGYLLKERVSDVAVLVDALRRVHEGECVVDPTIVSRLMSQRQDSGPLAELTAREREVLALMAEGHSNGAIRERLFLSPKTVETHVRQIFLKLDLRESPAQHRRVSAVLAFLRNPPQC